MQSHSNRKSKSLTASLGFREPDNLDITFATILANVINDEEMEDGYGILNMKRELTCFLAILNCPEWKFLLSA